MAEVADTCSNHSYVRRIRRRDDLLVAHRAARLNDCRHARVDRELGTVGEGEEGV
jgi:hypothetical protein